MSRSQGKVLRVAVVIASILVIWRTRMPSRDHILSDAFFITGLLLLLVGAIGVVHNSGLFDIVGYGSRCFRDLILNKTACAGQENDFAQYVHRQRRKHDLRPPLAGAVICLLAAVLFAAAAI